MVRTDSPAYSMLTRWPRSTAFRAVSIASSTVSPAVYLRETRVAISASTGEDMTRAFMPSSRANVRSVSAARSNS